jgi:tRNA(Arg) A34 adenosine deaminase TadA
MCLSAIYWARIPVVFYGNTRNDAANIGFYDSFIYDEVSVPIEERSIQMTRIASEEAKTSFTLWEKYDKRIDY